MGSAYEVRRDDVVVRHDAYCPVLFVIVGPPSLLNNSHHGYQHPVKGSQPPSGARTASLLLLGSSRQCFCCQLPFGTVKC